MPIKWNQIQSLPTAAGTVKEISITVFPPLVQVGQTTLIVETVCNITSNNNISWLEVFENGIKLIPGVNCGGLSWDIGGGKLSITVNGLDIDNSTNTVEADDKISIFVYTTQADAAFSN